MTNIKTAISIDKPLFEQMDALAHDMNTSRSRIFAMAASEFIERRKNLKLLEAINAAYDDFPDPNEASLGSEMRSRHLNMVKDQW
jgi:metal-responsive CopG/Arc/MetJ family transcriptional regulator